MLAAALALAGCALTECALAGCVSWEPGAPQEAPARPVSAEWLEACERGQDHFCQLLAREDGFRSMGPEHAVHVERAVRLGCERGSGEMCWRLGNIEERRGAGQGTASYERACALGVIAMCRLVFTEHSTPSQARYDAGRALAAAERACGQGALDMCGEALALIRRASLPREVGQLDRLHAARWCKAVPLDDPRCTKQLGLAYAGALGGPAEDRDPERARALLGPACEAGMLDACHVEASLLYRGEGGPADRARAVQRLERACDGGVRPACFMLARIALIRGRTLDPARAEAMFVRACDGDRACLADAGLRFASVRSWAHAERVLEQACTRGHDGACGDLGRVLVLSGRRPTDALRHLEGSCARDTKVACRAAAHLLSRRGKLHDPARARALAERGYEDPHGLTHAISGAMGRTVEGKGSTTDDWVTAAVVTGTLLMPALPFLFWHDDTRQPQGFGFEGYVFPDP